MKRFYKVTVGGCAPYQAKSITLAQAAEERRYAMVKAEEANLIVEAFSPRDACRVASMAYRGETLTMWRGPHKAVPVIIPSVDVTGSW